MTRDEILSRVAERMGLSRQEDAEPVVRTVLESIGERLSGPMRQALAEDLPSLQAENPPSEEPSVDFPLADLHERVSLRADVRIGQAVEFTAVVCQVLAEALTPGTLHRLREALPAPVSALFTPRQRSERFEHVHHDPGRHTLAEGRPGSRHPLSEARPERAHSDSVARSDNPHEETKLSSATGLTQERQHETLATGRPAAVHDPHDER
ncbi:DUF2267 domain-containing protein [Melittangium boletus]|uniref:DUF2267 domain-containing protein n=1 Tax=Melittangium boletus DSM 14713 TaxID=1294270 RepID=A0A250IL32_9BACT|nr:DUF2267 domain-containing protein [Melittangium boletus]ATB31952.1 hypothetical protein MEBOL_005424 [Melittangium boletus DSM 14713]